MAIPRSLRVRETRAAATAILIVCTFAAGCGGGGQQPTPDTSHEYVSLQIAPMVASVRTGATAGVAGSGNRFIAVGQRADGSGDYSWNLTSPLGSAKWSSSAPDVASVDSLGRFKALSAGTATISASLGTLTASTTLVVSDAAPVLTAVEINPGLPKIDDNGAITGIQFQAVSKYDDGSEMDVTTKGVWLSSDVSAATVDATGMVTYRSTADCAVLFLYGLSYNSFTLKHLTR